MSGIEGPMNEARDRLSLTDDEVLERFARFGYRVSIGHIAFTTEQVDDFREARLTWLRAGRLKIDEPGLLVIENAQPKPGQPTRDMVIVSLGHSRAVMGVHIKPGAPPLQSGSAMCRYAPTMQWQPTSAAPKPTDAPARR
jgi:hypothetical protein